MDLIMLHSAPFSQEIAILTGSKLPGRRGLFGGTPTSLGFELLFMVHLSFDLELVVLTLFPNPTGNIPSS